jgi:hypothetical protein
MSNDEEGTWHLEDDVFPCRDFAKTAMEHDDGIVHGFYHRYGDEKHDPGWVPMCKAGYSFPCFRLPNRYAVEFVDWFLNDAMHRDAYKRWVDGGKHIDSFMLAFLKERHADEKVLNLSPSIVEHVDEYIGGSTVNQWRKRWWKAEEFTDADIIEDLKIKLASR